MKKRVQDFKVVGNKALNKEYFTLTLQSDSKLPTILPGQFAEIRMDHSQDVFLRRPISFYKVYPDTNRFELLIQKAGKGSRLLSKVHTGETLNLIYPLGNSFTVPEKGRCLLIGGGVGIAPLLLLGEHIRKRKLDLNYLLGFRNRSLMIDFTEYEKYGGVYLTTDDGSFGEKGTVLDHSLLKNGISEYGRIYTCGPEVMMKAVARFAESKGIECEASLENTMACGFGACLCCIQPTSHGNLRVCMEGPVFNTKELIW